MIPMPPAIEQVPRPGSIGKSLRGPVTGRSAPIRSPSWTKALPPRRSGERCTAIVHRPSVGLAAERVLAADAGGRSSATCAPGAQPGSGCSGGVDQADLDDVVGEAGHPFDAQRAGHGTVSGFSGGWSVAGEPCMGELAG